MTNVIDITELLKNQPYVRHETLLRFKNTRPEFAAILNQIIDNYHSKGEQDQRITKLGEEIVADLSSVGTFYRCEPYLIYSYLGVVMVNIGDNNMFQLLLSNYKIFRGLRTYSAIRQIIQNHCFNEGLTGNIRKFSYYDKDSGALYRSNFAHHMWKITPEGIEVILNGNDGVMFENSHTFGVIDHHIEAQEGLFDEIVLAPLVTQLDPENEYNLSVDDQLKIFEYWFYSLFFESIQPTKPIMCAIGPAGSGKTSVLRRVGKLLFGASFNVRSMPQDRKDFDATILRNAYLVFDNVDGFRPWMCDGLSQVATGTTLEYRKLYSDFDTTAEDPHCFLGLTARTPKFARDDVSSRCLFLHTKRIEKSIPEATMLAQIEDNRDRLSAEINLRLQKIVSSLASHPQIPETSFRMADFACLCLRGSGEDKEKQELGAIFNRIDGSQAIFSLENSSFADVFRLWASEFLLDERTITLEILRKEMFRITKECEIDLMGIEKPHSLRRQFVSSLDSLRKVGYSIQQTGKHDEKRHKLWEFGPRGVD